MDKFNFRSGSRTLAIIDSVLSTIGFVCVLVLAILATVDALEAKNSEDNDEADSYAKTTVMYIMWGVLAIAFIFFAVHLYVAIKFFKASKRGTDYKEAAKRARIYRNLNIVVVTLSFLNIFSFSIYKFVGFLIGLCFRGLILYNVCNFIEELDGAIATPGFGNPDPVKVDL